MAHVCEICKKGEMAGNNVSHSNRHTVTTFKPNVQKVKAVVDGKVKIGIDAPKHISVHRKEIFLEIEKENKEASEISMEIFEEFKENH